VPALPLCGGTHRHQRRPTRRPSPLSAPPHGRRPAKARSLRPVNDSTPSTPPARLGLGLLVALVVGSIVGSGIFGLPQNMAAGAGAGSILIGWGITGVGMLLLVRVFQMLSMRQPALDNGVYADARALGGEYVGFNATWGYWVSAWFGNVGYLVAAFGALGCFFPVFGGGNSPAAMVGASLVLWAVHLMVLRGVQGAAVLNAVVTAAKIVPLLVFIVLVALAFEPATFRLDFWGTPTLGTVLGQVKSTILVTVWVFMGIEGASVYSARAKGRQDVGRATVIGFLVCPALLVPVSLLSLGIVNQATLAGLPNPSMAWVPERAVGTWGGVLIDVGLIVAVGGGFLAWMLLAAGSLFTPAGGGSMPAWLATLYCAWQLFAAGSKHLLLSASSGTTATTCWHSHQASWWATRATPTPTRCCARPAWR